MTCICSGVRNTPVSPFCGADHTSATILCGWSDRVVFRGMALRQQCGKTFPSVESLAAHVREAHK